MYKLFVRPFLFLINPESVHHIVTGILKIIFSLPFTGFLSKRCFYVSDPSLSRQLWGLTFENPVGLAAGFDKDARYLKEFGKLGFSFIEIGTVTPEGQKGNLKPRLFRIIQDKALVNRMGFNNLGVQEAVERLKCRPKNLIVGGNIGKNTFTSNDNAVNDYVYSFKQLYPYVDYIVVNVSCPNVSALHELQDKDALLIILSALQKERAKEDYKKPILLKISPDLNFNQIDDVLEIVKITEIDGIVATNTTVQRSFLTISKEKIEVIGNGGLSGNPIKNRSTEVIRYISKMTNGKLPIIGVGGIMNPLDALEKIEAGATLIQVYTGFIYEGPSIVKQINQAILKAKISV